MAFSPQWHALGREAELAADQIGSGITALGRASHARKGVYARAFFGLSVGLERLAKLVIVANYALANAGRFISNEDLRAIGHDIARLFDRCEAISAVHRRGMEFSDRPNDPIHRGIVETLSEFARRSRYYNLDLISEGEPAIAEPTGAWWRRVGQPILARHYPLRQREHDARTAAAITEVMGDVATVLHFTEEDNQIVDLDQFLLHDAATRVVQRYGRLYTLQIVRWLAFLISDLSHRGAHDERIEPLLGLDELFVAFRNDDAYFRTRKIW
jgi:hypothetical protein